jgi:hypothetical protein
LLVSALCLILDEVAGVMMRFRSDSVHERDAMPVLDEVDNGGVASVAAPSRKPIA